MKKSDFFAQYKDPRWQKKRLQIMERDEFMCQVCADNTQTLNIHHKYYIQDKAPWEYPDSLLITLCEDCHRSQENDKYIINDFTKVLLNDGYSTSDLVILLELLQKLPSGDYGLSYISDAVKKYHKSLPF